MRRVVHLRTVCKFFRKALGKKEAPHKLLELLGVPDIAAAMGRSAHLTAPSEDYPDVYACVRAVRAFKEVRVLGERPLEIRLLAGNHRSVVVDVDGIHVRARVVVVLVGPSKNAQPRPQPQPCGDEQVEAPGSGDQGH